MRLRIYVVQKPGLVFSLSAFSRIQTFVTKYNPAAYTHCTLSLSIAAQPRKWLSCYAQRYAVLGLPINI